MRASVPPRRSRQPGYWGNLLRHTSLLGRPRRSTYRSTLAAGSSCLVWLATCPSTAPGHAWYAPAVSGSGPDEREGGEACSAISWSCRWSCGISTRRWSATRASSGSRCITAASPRSSASRTRSCRRASATSSCYSRRIRPKPRAAFSPGTARACTSWASSARTFRARPPISSQRGRGWMTGARTSRGASPDAHGVFVELRHRERYD
jgi:hypothetical protein